MFDYNFSDNQNQTNDGTNCTIQNNYFITGAWPAEAVSIMNNAGRVGVTKPYMSTNYSENKISKSSSAYSSSYSAKLSNDGNLNTIWASNTQEQNPWWQVDLGEVCKFSTIQLIARQDIDQAGGRTNFAVLGSNDSTFTTYAVLGSKTGADFPAYGTWALGLNSSVNYRYVRVQRINNAGHFNFAELQVIDSIVYASKIMVKNIFALILIIDGYWYCIQYFLF